MKKPLQAFIQKIFRLIHSKLLNSVRRYRDNMNCTYYKFNSNFDLRILSHLSPIYRASMEGYQNQNSFPLNHYSDHCFDLLGSGWARVFHGMRCRGRRDNYQMGTLVQADPEGRWLEGRINRANISESRRIWQLVDYDYSPIDWHIDFISGFRWDESTWYMDVPFAHKPGVDIKVPWELARMQHLPQLAINYGYSVFDPNSRHSMQTSVWEFSNQVLDFVATNPPRFGVNWRCTMDVAIRVSNWLFAYDYFKAHGAKFDSAFETEFVNSVFVHGRHIVENLEWNHDLRGNHYLSNIVGLLFVAAYLPRTPQVDAWLAFAVQELVAEVHYQFNNDGTNFEASTSYHCLSLEMVIYASAVVLGLSDEKKCVLQDYNYNLHRHRPKLKRAPIPLYATLNKAGGLSPFPVSYVERLIKMIRFVVDVTKPNGQIVQIGDNDSGRFLKLSTMYQHLTVKKAKERYKNLHNYTDMCDGNDYQYEGHLDCSGLIGASRGLLKECDVGSCLSVETIETDIINRIAGGRKLTMAFESNSEKKRCEKETKSTPVSGYVCSTLTSYHDFGLFVYRYGEVYLAIRCGPNGQNGNGGHCHNDKLLIELNIAGADFFVDGGSYIYTAYPDLRNYFRSTAAHTTLGVFEKEQNNWSAGNKGIFSMTDSAHEKVVRVTETVFEGSHRGFGVEHRRKISWNEDRNKLIIEDSFPGFIDSSYLSFNLHPAARVEEIRKERENYYLVAIRSGGVNLLLNVEGVKSVYIDDGFYSPGYGQREKNLRLVCIRSKAVTTAALRFP